MGGKTGRIGLQERLFSTWEAELRALGLEGPPSLAQRKERLYREIESLPLRRKSSSGEWIRRVRKEGGALLVGDYHTLPRAQKAAGKILSLLVKAGSSPLLMLECFSGRHEKALREWNQGRIGTGTLRARTSFDETWGFPWEGYAHLLERARRLGVPVLPLEGGSSRRGMAGREREMARRVLRALRARPGRPAFLLVGDLHLSREGIPSILDEAGVPTFRIFQNLETVYWDLSSQGSLRKETWVELGDRTWCLLETHPLWKLQSAFTWLEDRVFQAGKEGPDVALSEKALELAQAMGEHLGIALPPYRAPLVFTGDPFPFLDLLHAMKVRAPSRRAFLSQVRACGIYLPPGRDLVFLVSPSLNFLAEAAARWLAETAKPARRSPHTPEGTFLHAVLDHALGWAGSLLFNPFRARSAGPGVPRGFWPLLDGSRKGFEALGERVRRVPPTERCFLARRLGRALGTAIYGVLEQGIQEESLLGELFLSRPAGPKGVYTFLSSVLEKEGILERMGGTAGRSGR